MQLQQVIASQSLVLSFPPAVLFYVPSDKLIALGVLWKDGAAPLHVAALLWRFAAGTSRDFEVERDLGMHLFLFLRLFQFKRCRN